MSNSAFNMTAPTLVASTVEIDLGSIPVSSGNFQITGLSGLTPGASVIIQQAVGPYTSKGTLVDEAEMEFLGAAAYVVDASTIQVYWNALNGPVRGKFRFTYSPQLPIAGIAGLTDPGGNGVIKRTGLNTTAPAASSDVVGLFSGTPTGAKFLRDDGTLQQQGGAWVQIQQIITSGSQATLDFSSIPSTYNHLKLILMTRDTAGGTNAVQIRLRLNNDSTSGNYSGTARAGSSNAVAYTSVVAATANGGFLHNHPVDGNAANVYASSESTIVGCSSANFHKRVQTVWSGEDTTNGLQMGTGGFRYGSLSAINRLTVITEGTAFKDNSMGTLYGIL